MTTPPTPEQGERIIAEAFAAAPPELVAAIAKAMSEAGDVTKDGRNPEHNYRYATIEGILRAVRGPLLDEGVILIPQPRAYDESEVRSSGNKAGTRIVIEVDYTFVGHGGTAAVRAWRGEGVDWGDKAYGKAYTNALKTFIRSAWLLAVDDDSDPERESPERVAASNGNTQAAPLPDWARDTTDERRAEFIAAALELGLEREAAANLLKGALERFGVVPNLMVIAARWLAQSTPDAIAKREADAAAKAAEAADPTAPAEPVTVPPEEPPLEPERPAAPGSRRAPDLTGANLDDPNDRDQVERLLRNMGCTCDKPLAAIDLERNKVTVEEVQAEEMIDDACPIAGHGHPY